MFDTVLNGIPVFGDAGSEELFPTVRILGDPIDKVFPAVLRALLPGRLKENETPFIFDIACDDFESAPKENAIYLLQKLDATDGLVELKDVETFLKKNCDDIEIKVYTNEPGNLSVIVGGLNNKALHTLAALIPRLLKHYFIDQPLTPDESEMVQAIVRPYESAFLEKINMLPLAVKLRRKANALKVKGLTSMFLRRRMDFAKAELDRARERVETAFENYTKQLSARTDAVTKFEGARVQYENGGDDSVLSDFLKDSEQIEVLSCDNGELEIMIDNYLDQYDADSFENFSDRFYHDVTQRGLRNWNVDDMKIVLNAIFSSTPKLRVKVSGYYKLSLSGGVRTQRDFSMSGRSDRLPNPHLHMHRCLGDYEADINQAMEAGNILSALNLCNASCMSINVNESPTFNPFCAQLLSSREKILHAEDGRDMTPKEALEWLKANE